MLYLIFSSTCKFSQLITYFRHNIPEHTMIAYMIRCRKSCGGQIAWLFVALSLANQDHVYCQWQRVVYQCFDRREFSKKNTHTNNNTFCFKIYVKAKESLFTHMYYFITCCYLAKLNAQEFKSSTSSTSDKYSFTFLTEGQTTECFSATDT